ncbi:TRAP transporter substrate-binding protein [Roseibium sp. Sym1]|uniref:TRAP transporter substrate-binding protein n=1 Tax=Roseibium sp. Sym1 TaxID=3016006 RepID=UPI0022B5E106|nr:hypothetical protein [Roseibium sp. Sym1]
MTRAFLKSAVAAVALFGASAIAQAQDVTLTLHHFMSPKSPPHAKFLEPWVEKIEAESDGRIKVELFPSMSLGGKPPELYRQVRDGAADIILTITGDARAVVPFFAIEILRIALLLLVPGLCLWLPWFLAG